MRLTDALVEEMATAAEGICAQCRDHTGFDNPDLEYAQAALARYRGGAA